MQMVLEAEAKSKVTVKELLKKLFAVSQEFSALMPYVFVIQFNIILPFTPDCPKWPLFVRFADKRLYSLSMYIMPVVCFAHIHFYLNVIIQGC
jgi:hypothetical protein